jgi:hypothetical protein
MPRTTNTVSQPLTKRRKPRREYKKLPKGTTSHFEWRGNAFVEIFTINGYRYVKHFTHDDNSKLNITN